MCILDIYIILTETCRPISFLKVLYKDDRTSYALHGKCTKVLPEEKFEELKIDKPSKIENDKEYSRDCGWPRRP